LKKEEWALTTTMIQKTRSRLDALTNEEEGSREKFTGMQSKQVPALKKNVNQVMEALEDKAIADILTSTDDMLKKLEEWENQVKEYGVNSRM
jgi:hypothetical protein